ncbi:hypothetical protein GCM10010531_16700 [Blastococcus jejuensis]|uniref:Cupin domain-containing protein n=1 Tax=Blastococcus jejuensis TaxID=351224 RepID=A0ABP6P2Y9_9ACTN
MHGFRNDTDDPTSFLILYTPGIARVKFFAEIADLANGGRTLQGHARTALYARHDQVMVDD